jgi:hypothetical protein
MEAGFENGELVPVELVPEPPEEIDEHTHRIALNFAYQIAGDMVRRAMLYIIDDPKPSLAADTIGCAFGLRLRQGISDKQVADRHGISKEALSQRKARLMKLLGLKRIIVRGGKLRTNQYKYANYRRPTGAS